MNEHFEIPDGLDELRDEMPQAIALIARTARWVNPKSFAALPVWFPEHARGKASYNAAWTHRAMNTNRSTGTVAPKSEPNIQAAKALRLGLGVQKATNWTVCHLWGVDDPTFQKQNSVVKDPRFYSCVGNMILLPTPLKGFTDAVPEIKEMLRTCAYYLYGWACDHPDVKLSAEQVLAGQVPTGYPDIWPTPTNNPKVPGVAPFSQKVENAIERRKANLRRMLADPTLEYFPRAQVLEVLEYWRIQL